MNKRENELYKLWSNESNDPGSEEWRENLTPDETALVEKWDNGYEIGMARIAGQIIDAEQRRDKLRNKEG